MKITLTNTQDYLIGLIALSGEIPSNLKLKEIKSNTITQKISLLKRRQVLHSDKEHNRVRLRSPNGLDALKNLDENLYKHYMMMSNNHKFKRSKSGVKSLKNYSETILFMIKNGISIDNIKLNYHSKKIGNKPPDTSEEIDVLGNDYFYRDEKYITIKDATTLITEPKFLTAKFLKHIAPVTDRINLACTNGILMTKDRMYSVFHGEEGMTFSASGEARMNDLIKNISLHSYGRVPDKVTALVITPNKEEIFSVLREKGKSFSKTFKRFYIIPSDEHGNNILNIHKTEDWKTKLQILLYGEARSGIYDGEVNNAPSWELLSGNYYIIKELKRTAKKRPVHFICYEWQKKMIKTLAKDLNVTLTVLTKEQEETLNKFFAKEQEENG